MSRFILLFIAITVLNPERSFSTPEDLQTELGAVLKGLPWSAGLSVVDTESEKEIASYRSEEPLKPASVLKILTAYVALDSLGPEFTFRTTILGEIDGKGHVPELIVKGGGDPNLTLEEIWKIGRALRVRGVQRVGKIVVDDSLFQSKSPSGVRAYEAGSAPLACSFNSVLFRLCPTSKGERASVSFEPFETNITLEGSVITTGRGSAPTYSIDRAAKGEFSYKVSGGIPEDVDCVQVFRNVTDAASYCREVISGIFSSVGILVGGEGLLKGISSNKNAPILYEHDSIPLASIVRGLNHFSTNFIAEEIIYSLGQESASVWSYSSGLRKVSSYAKSLGFQALSVHDGSGLSHDNKIPPKLVSMLLAKASKNDRVGPELEASLPIAGRSGTLKRRDFGALNGELRGKTGSLDGVVSLAGYVRGRSGARYAFTVFQNGVSSKDRALEIEHKIARRISELG